MNYILAALQPNVLLPLLISMFFGIFVGGMPGLTATMAVALIIPITYYMPPLAALAMILGASFSSIFAGDIPATFLRIPGTPASGAAVLDGFEMSKKGKGALALSLDLICSATGGVIGVLLLILVAPPLAKFALKFTNYEYFWLGIFGLSMSAVLSRGNLIKGLSSALLGLLIATIGIDVTTGYPRFTFGSIELMDGIGFIPAMIGLFGISEVLKRIQGSEKDLELPAINEKIKPSLLAAFKIMIKKFFIVIKSAIIGTFVGALPGAGADIAAWVAYGVEKKTSKKSEEFGTGIVEGVIAPTSANNAALGGTWIPALVFGIPGDTITAIVLGAMLMYGLRPGPLIFQENGELIKGLFFIAILIQFLLIVVGYFGIRVYTYFLKMKTSVVLTAVIMFSMIGSYAIRNSYFDIYIMLIFGIIGYLFEKIDVPLAPMILGIILGPMIEDNLRVGLTKTGGNWMPFFTRPISIAFIVLIFFVFFGTYIVKLLKKFL
ncbi:tripartite tricarboxylate transporter permease [Thermosipho atlanticus]|uniref:TctA family transporter n=1 Tax=Thermosipho atlanticus DSM 15807 TaxID=1123380 RepID=A0A1M5RBV0_9BACT|nr:tripartite tricarboxylate transporter permease [Thermosipho atlanticus]SHH23741.1 TctA family transporter [Thermosipho atlanticus DSM 15807]